MTDIPKRSNFQVDLAGIVELLSRNLYSGPQVFVRELLQNGFDAIIARQQLDASAPAEIRFITDGNTLYVCDSGVGLTLAEAKKLLATIGASSKRDELGLSRSDYLGQFGIGLLSCFMVSDTITVYSASAKTAGQEIVKWEGRANGTWNISLVRRTDAPTFMPLVGTCVLLQSLRGNRYFEYGFLERLLTEYGEYLPLRITLERVGTRTNPNPLADKPKPWDLPPAQQTQWCAENFGFMPFSGIKIEIPIAGIKGIGFVLATGANPGQSLKHRVYLRNMLLSKTATDLLPDWAYFIRLVLNTEHLKPTASREQLFDDDLLEATREELGKAIRSWLNQLARNHPDSFRKFTLLHMNGLKALAINDRDTRDLVAASVPYQTSLGTLTLDEIIKKHGTIRFTRSDNEFKTLEPVAAANNFCILNASFAFDEELLGQLALDRPEARILPLNPMEVLGALEPLSVSEEIDLMPIIAQAEESLAAEKVQVEIRRFEPANMPVLYLPDADMAGLVIESRAAAAAEGAFSDLIEMVNATKTNSELEKKPRLIFNAKAAIIYELAGATNKSVVTSAVRGLYVQSLLAGRHPLSTQVRSWSTSVFTSLISHSLRFG